MKRILHLSDPHFGAVDLTAAEKFVECAPALKPDVTILSGDLTMRVRRSELLLAKSFVDRLPTPLLIIPGNHDIPAMNHPFDRFFRAFRRYQETFGEELEPELEQDGIHVVSLNSSRPFGLYRDWSEGRVSKAQLLRMQDQFSKSAHGACRVLVLHHPLLELQIKGRAVVKPLAELLQAIEDAKVDLVLCGHFHRSQVHAVGLTSQWKAIISQAPTVCSTRLQGEPQGFHEICVHDEEIEIIHHVYHNATFTPTGSYHYHKSKTGWNDGRLALLPDLTE